MPIKSVNSYQVEKKILKTSLTLLWILDFALYLHTSTFKCVISLLEIIYFVSLKQLVFVFLDEDTFQGGSQVLQNLEGVEEGGGCCCLTDLDFFLEGGQVKSGEINISIFQGGTDSLEKTMLSVPFSNYLVPFIYCPLKMCHWPEKID